jgi:hypothetical protein
MKSPEDPPMLQKVQRKLLYTQRNRRVHILHGIVYLNTTLDALSLKKLYG